MQPNKIPLQVQINVDAEDDDLSDETSDDQ